jgi:YgiT-type zinc finger domain-containing protein
MKTKQKSDLKNRIQSYWTGEICETCGGSSIVDKDVELYRHRDNKRYLFEHVPAGVCSDCGARYFTANVAKMMEEKLRRSQGRRARKTVTIPILSF